MPFYLKEQKEPWATLLTKKPDAVHLVLAGPKGRFTLGQVRKLGHEPELDAQRPECDQIRLKFRSLEDVERGRLAEFLGRHRAAVTENGRQEGE